MRSPSSSTYCRLLGSILSFSHHTTRQRKTAVRLPTTIRCKSSFHLAYRCSALRLLRRGLQVDDLGSLPDHLVSDTIPAKTPRLALSIAHYAANFISTFVDNIRSKFCAYIFQYPLANGRKSWKIEPDWTILQVYIELSLCISNWHLIALDKIYCVRKVLLT